VSSRETIDTLAVAAQAGDKAAYRALLGQSQMWLKRYLSRKAPPGQADDIAQDALLAVHQKLHTYDPQRPFTPWLAAIARHKWIEALRRQGRAPTEELGEAVGEGDHGRDVLSGHLLGGLLAQLPKGQAEAIRLTKLVGFSVEEAAQRLSQSAVLVRVNVYRGLRRLEALIADEDMAR
jgi:RNA polymerase sigma factor (sigma-70 family)